MLKKCGLVLLAIFLGQSALQAEAKRLLGRWETVQQSDKAKAKSCLYFLDFRNDGTVVQRWSADGGITETVHKYKAGKDRLDIAINAETQWKITYKFLANGNLALAKEPWNWQATLTKNASSVPSNHGCAVVSDTAVESIYTEISDEACPAVDEPEVEEGTSRRCHGPAGYQLLNQYGDMRASVSLITPRGEQHDLNFWDVITPGFSALGPKAEWRSRKNTKEPHALIVQVNAHENPADPEHTTSYLAVMKIAKDKICVTDRIKTADVTSEAARLAADNSAGQPCLTTLPAALPVTTVEYKGKIKCRAEKIAKSAALKELAAKPVGCGETVLAPGEPVVRRIEFKNHDVYLFTFPVEPANDSQMRMPSGPTILEFDGKIYPLTGPASLDHTLAFEENGELILETGFSGVACGVVVDQVWKLTPQGPQLLREDASRST